MRGEERSGSVVHRYVHSAGLDSTSFIDAALGVDPGVDLNVDLDAVNTSNP
jgi:hypothetical protein